MDLKTEKDGSVAASMLPYQYLSYSRHVQSCVEALPSCLSICRGAAFIQDGPHQLAKQAGHLENKLVQEQLWHGYQQSAGGEV
jgi:hypothetical protein